MPESGQGELMEGKVCLVTGASGGIGLVSASELARQGARVIGVGRSRERCDSAVRQIRDRTGSRSVEYLVADLSSQKEIRDLASEVRAATDRLDVLLNNAGGVFVRRRESVDGLEMTFALNHMAYFLLTNLLIDLIQASAPARVVNVSSAAHQGVKLDFDDLQARNKRYSGWRAYQKSKLANIFFTRELARRLEGSGVTANALHPGYVNTQIFSTGGFSGWLLRRAADLFAISPEQGADTSIYLASSPAIEGISGKYFYKRSETSPSPAAHDNSAARRLWEVSEQLAGLPSATVG
jgi:NAD(P)-dependent dehydrogenase (short-subunit alcohol dehydrogenase family)